MTFQFNGKPTTTIQLIKRIIMMVVGLFAMGLGSSVVTVQYLGTVPTSVIAYVMSLFTPLSMGTYVFIVNIILMFIQFLILRRKYRPILLLQLPTSFLISVFVDLTMAWLKNYHMPNFGVGVIMVAIGIALLAFGIVLQVYADITLLTGEQTAAVIAETFHLNFGHTKVYVDAAQVVVAFVISLIALHSIQGIHIFTLVTAVFTGFVVNWFLKLFEPLKALLDS